MMEKAVVKRERSKKGEREENGKEKDGAKQVEGETADRRKSKKGE